LPASSFRRLRPLQNLSAQLSRPEPSHNFFIYLLKMASSLKSKPKRTELSTQLPTIPTMQEMWTWDDEKVLRWIQRNLPGVLKGDDLDAFTKFDFTGVTFLGSDYKFFSEVCRLSPGASLGLRGLVNAVKEGKLIPWTNSDTS